jgi:anti-sigma B factor antagonist
MTYPAAPGLRIVSERGDDAVVIALDGDLDLATAAPMRDALSTALGTDKARIVVDMRRLAFLDSTGIHTLVQMHERCLESARSFQIVLGEGHVRRVLEVSGMLRVLDHMTEEGLAA